jgi:hypothetical protein
MIRITLVLHKKTAEITQTLAGHGFGMGEALAYGVWLVKGSVRSAKQYGAGTVMGRLRGRNRVSTHCPTPFLTIAAYLRHLCCIRSAYEAQGRRTRLRELTVR